ncbi:YlqD family protein [Priestia filamentosa]|uniref:YlqD family protein n=1 Tax=Priestia filamentosa TaxID=1402861 RepID=UPI0003175B94|nr:YlqD family protein [Priestia filamentosa]
MKVVQKVIVKQVLTEQSKEKLRNKFILEQKGLQNEIEQLRFQLRKIENMKKPSAASLEKQFEKEQKTRLEKLRIIDFQLEQLNLLPIGSELEETKLDAIVEVKEGDSWEEFKSLQTILVKDGIVIEIR